MNVRLSELDREIHQLEERIADDRAQFMSALSACGHSVRETVSSPKALLAVAAVGFVAGKLLFRPGKSASAREEKEHRQQSKTGGALGLLAAGLSLLQPGYGPGGIARWAAQQLWEWRKKKQPRARAQTGPRGAQTGYMPQVRTPRHGVRADVPVTGVGR
jgi:hypothetical protein